MEEDNSILDFFINATPTSAVTNTVSWNSVQATSNTELWVTPTGAGDTSTNGSNFTWYTMDELGLRPALEVEPLSVEEAEEENNIIENDYDKWK